MRESRRAAGRLKRLALHTLVCVGTELLPFHGLVAGTQAFEKASSCRVVLLDQLFEELELSFH